MHAQSTNAPNVARGAASGTFGINIIGADEPGRASIAAPSGSSEQQVEAAQFGEYLRHFEESAFQLLYAIEALLLKRGPHDSVATALPQ